MSKPKVLIITGALPYPLVTGAKIRTFNLLKSLAGDFEIGLLTVLSTPPDADYIEQFTEAGIHCHTLKRFNSENPISRNLDAFMSYILPDPYLIRHYTFSAYRRRLEALLNAENYGVIHCDSISMTGNLAGLDRNKMILTQHNIEQNIWAGYVEHASGPAAIFYRNQYRKVKRLEENLASTYGYIVTVSEDDKTKLSPYFSREKIFVVENGVDPEAYRNDIPADKRSGIVFTGSLDWHPNIDGLTWFAREIFPELKKRLPQCSTTIVGRKPANSLVTAISGLTGIDLKADVPQIQPHLFAAGVMMVPLRIGGGSRLKILEAMAAGIPVVSTSKGAEGLAVTDREDIIIEDNPNRFAEALVQVMQDDGLRQKLSEKGRELIERRYSWKQVARPLAELWQKVADV